MLPFKGHLVSDCYSGRHVNLLDGVFFTLLCFLSFIYVMSLCMYVYLCLWGGYDVYCMYLCLYEYVCLFVCLPVCV
jgi:hypothetical protein